MRVFLYYLKSRVIFILTLVLADGIFGLISYLYDLPQEPTVYSYILSTAIVLLLCAADYIRFFKKHCVLKQISGNIAITPDCLPVPDDILEQDYQQLIQAVSEAKKDDISRIDSEKQDMMEYYTIWAHQIKTPIAAIKLILQSDQNEVNDELSGQLMKIEQYVEMALSYMRLNSDYTDFVIKEYSLDSIVKQAVRKHASSFIRKKIDLNLSELKTTVLTDEKWLSFVIEQVLSNALKYTNKGSISIYVADRATLVIRDTGIGISPDDLPRICDKGYTGYNGRIDKKATGIGLYLSKRILTKLGHSIKFESQVGKGTIVMIDLYSDRVTAD